MLKRLGLAALIAVLFATSAHAVETFTFSGVWANVDFSVRSPWIGSVSFDVDGDGTFENASWSMTSNQISISREFTVSTPADITIANGQIVALDVLPTRFGMNATGVFYHDVEPTVGVTQGFAPFDVVQTSPVPEPETWALLIAGLCVLGVVRRKSGKGD